MSTEYMIIWSSVMVIGLSLLRVRQWRQIVVMAVATFLVLASSNALFVQLSLGAGIDPSIIGPIDPAQYLAAGLIGWLALFVLPCGWLAPVVGLHLVQKLQHHQLNGMLVPLSAD